MSFTGGRLVVSPERQMYNTVILPKFIDSGLKPRMLVIDVGKPDEGWGYKSLFEDMIYLTLDKKAELCPDIIDDMENTVLEDNTVDALICMGIWEQCFDPAKMADSVKKIVKIGGYVLFGIMALGYPEIQEEDYQRFTVMGAKRLVSDFKICELSLAKRGDMVSYVFAICQKLA